MASYLRSFFSGPQPPHGSGSDGLKSHSRSQSSSALPLNPTHFYPMVGVATSTSSSSSRTREHVNASYLSGTRTTPPSPLRYESGAFRFSRSSSRQHTHVQSQSSSRAPLAGSSRENVVTYVPFNPTQSFSSTRSTTSSNGYSPTKPTRPTFSRTSSSASVARSDAGSEPKPVLKKGRSDSSSSTKSGPRPHVSFENPYRAVSLHMHPLLAYSKLHSAPISYDVTFPPTPQTVVDRSTHTSIPGHTLSQPATDPPTYGELVLHSDKFPWPVVVVAGCAPGAGQHPLTHHQQNENYHPSSPYTPHRQNSSGSGSSGVVVTNMDVLYAIYTTLSSRVTQDEWESLGHGSRSQRKATRAYQKRCTKLGGAWTEGVRRIDYLGEKSRLIGVEVDKSVDSAGWGKLVFGKA